MILRGLLTTDKYLKLTRKQWGTTNEVSMVLWGFGIYIEFSLTNVLNIGQSIKHQIYQINWDAEHNCNVLTVDDYR